MSSIKVWTSDGNWSEPVNGCDKIHLIKEAIERECSIAKKKYKGDRLILSAEEVTWGCYGPDDKPYRIFNSGLQVGNKEIALSNLIDEDWCVYFERLDLSNASFFRMHLSTLEEMAKEEKTMSAVYTKLIHLAKVPEKVSKGYCLFFMFANE